MESGSEVVMSCRHQPGAGRTIAPIDQRRMRIQHARFDERGDELDHRTFDACYVAGRQHGRRHIGDGDSDRVAGGAAGCIDDGQRDGAFAAFECRFRLERGPVFL